MTIQDPRYAEPFLEGSEIMSSNERAAKQPAQGKGRIDWAAAKLWFFADHSRTLADVAREFKLNTSTLRSKAAAEKWVADRSAATAEAHQKVAEAQQAEHVDRCNVQDDVTKYRFFLFLIGSLISFFGYALIRTSGIWWNLFGCVMALWGIWEIFIALFGSDESVAKSLYQIVSGKK